MKLRITAKTQFRNY